MTFDDTEPTAAVRTSRRTRSDGERSRAAILREAARLATVEGLDGLSLGRLADAVGMSKSGIYAHFGSKEELQLATVDAAARIFDDEVLTPASRAPHGVARLHAFVDRFLAHIHDGVFPGGCFFAAAASELDTHPGPVRDRAMAVNTDWLGRLAAEVAAGQAGGELDPSAVPEQIAFELNSYLFLGNTLYVLSGDEAILDRIRSAVDTRIAALAV